MHNAKSYRKGAYADDACYDKTNRAYCDSGDWVPKSCGVNNACETNTCKVGLLGSYCVQNLADKGTVCNETLACSPDGNGGQYDGGGNYLCQQVCDGKGNCKYAGNCVDCAGSYENAKGWCDDSIDPNVCVLDCKDRYADCDGELENGCEELLDTDPKCDDAQVLDDVQGNTLCGGRCVSCFDSHVKQAGKGEAWFVVNVVDKYPLCSDSKMQLTVLLTPADDFDKANYDLYVYDACGGHLVGSSTNSDSVDVVTTEWTSGDRKFYINVVYKSGDDNCKGWGLSLVGGGRVISTF